MPTRRPGEFCWINMLTSNPAGARAFFGELLGWTFFEMGGGLGPAKGTRKVHLAGGLTNAVRPQWLRHAGEGEREVVKQ